MQSTLFVLFILMFVQPGAEQEGDTWIVTHPDRNLSDEPAYAEISADRFTGNSVCLAIESVENADGQGTVGSRIPAQIELIDRDHARLWWVVNQAAGETVRYRLVPNDECVSEGFSWQDTGERSSRLVRNGQPVIQYEYPVYDPEDVPHTKKPFHHVFDPAGTRKITKGPGGLYSHHQGIYLGYYVYLDGSDELIDIWHARDGERSEHNRILEQFEGPVYGGHQVRIDWKDHESNVFIDEKREIRVFHQSDGEWLIDVRSELTALRNHVKLGGDRHHAGLQFRAAQYVADHSETTRFIRPDDRMHVTADAELGDEHNLDYPWNAMFFEIEGQTYTVAYMSHPDNPDGAEMSERLYGRFGEFTPYELNRGESLTLSYRFWVKEGERPDQAAIHQRYEVLASPPSVMPE